MPAYSLGGSGAFAVTTSSSQGISGTKTFSPLTVSGIPIIVQGLSGQTGALTEWQTSAGGFIARVDSFGNILTNGQFAAYGPVNPQLFLSASRATDRGMVIRAAASATANMAEFQNSAGTVLTRVDNAGNITAPALGMAGATYSGGFISGANSRLHIIPGDTGGMAMTIRALAGQTANLVEWQTNAGAIASFIRNNGSLQVSAVTTGQYQGFFGGQTAGDAVLGVRGAASQTAPIFEVLNSANTILTSINPDGIIVTRSININNLYSGFQPVLYLNAHPSQSANMTEWRSSGNVVISRVLSNGSFEMVGQAPTVVGATIFNSSNLGTGAGAKIFIAKMHTNTSNATGFYIDMVRAAAGGTDWSTADLYLRRFTDNTDQNNICFAGNAQNYYTANQHNFNSAVAATSYITTSTLASKQDIAYLDSGAAESRSLEGRKASPQANESLAERFSKLCPVSYYSKREIAEDKENMKVNPRRQRLHSFVAEEAAEVMPEIVSFDANGVPEGIDLNATSAIQTLVIQELMQRIEKLEALANLKK